MTLALLALGGWAVVASFPLIAAPQPVAAVVTQGEARHEASPSRVSAAPAPKVSTPAVARPSVPPQREEWDEPIAGPITTASSPAARAAALALLEQARQNSDLHIAGTPPFHIVATFDASGQVADVGHGELSETWMSGQRWRWTAMLGGYASVRIGSGRTAYDLAPTVPLPMRVQMLRRVLFGAVPVIRGGRIRLAPARTSGAAVTCILVAPAASPETPVRLWHEDEYCIDEAGLLRVHSPAPGAYTRLDYTRSLRFGGRVLPGELRAYVGGAEVERARIDIRPAGDADEALFTATPEMIARGLAPTTGFAQKVLLRAPAQAVVPGAAISVVHVTVDASGTVVEAEVASGDPQQSSAALEIARAHRFPDNGMQRDAYVGVDFGGPADPTP